MQSLYMAMQVPGANVGDEDAVGEAVAGLPVGAGVVGAASPSMDTSALEATLVRYGFKCYLVLLGTYQL